MKRACYTHQALVYWWIRVGSGVESTSFPLSQQAWNPVQGNFRRSLCFGWLSSSRSPVILWSGWAPRSPLRSLSILVSLMWEKTLSGETKVSDSPPGFPPAGPFQPSSPPPPPPGDPRQVTGGKKKSFFVSHQRRLFPHEVNSRRNHNTQRGLSKRANPQSAFGHFRHEDNLQNVHVVLRSIAFCTKLWPM